MTAMSERTIEATTTTALDEAAASPVVRGLVVITLAAPVEARTPEVIFPDVATAAFPEVIVMFIIIPDVTPWLVVDEAIGLLLEKFPNKMMSEHESPS